MAPTARALPAPAVGLCAAVLLGAALTACGGGGQDGGSAAGSASVSATADAAPATAEASATAAADCTPSADVAAAVKGFPEVTGVQVIGGCGEISVATTLPPGSLGTPSATRATAICAAVSKVAYVGSIYGVTVVGQDGHELAAGIKDQPDCIPG